MVTHHNSTSGRAQCCSNAIPQYLSVYQNLYDDTCSAINIPNYLGGFVVTYLPVYLLAYLFTYAWTTPFYSWCFIDAFCVDKGAKWSSGFVSNTFIQCVLCGLHLADFKHVLQSQSINSREGAREPILKYVNKLLSRIKDRI